MKYIPLTPRLATVADVVPQCNTVADIGTDHAYVPIFLVQSGRALNAIASDIVPGPIEIAETNIRKHGLLHKIRTVTAPGLNGIENADVIIIAGMGGKMIIDIISDNMEKAKNSTLVLQPMTAKAELRKYLFSSKFCILEERLAKEGNKLYNIMVVKSGQDEKCSEIEYYIGKKLIDKSDPLLPLFINKEIAKLDLAMSHMRNATSGTKIQEMELLRASLLEVSDRINGKTL